MNLQMLDGLDGAAARILDELDAAATRIGTPCGDGEMVWRVWNASAGDPMVLLHGGSGSWRHWVRQIPRFAASRCVIAADLPGLGDSALPDGPPEPPNVARVTAAGLRQVLEGRRADLVAFSYGANVSGHVAAAVGPLLRSLLLAGAGSLGVPRNPVPLTKIRDKEGEARIAAHRANLASLMLADPRRADDLAVAIQECNTVLGRFRSRGFANSTQLKDSLAGTTMPLHALWGEFDNVAVGGIPARIAALRELRPDAATQVIPGAGHWVMYEAADEFDSTVLRFHQAVARGGA